MRTQTCNVIQSIKKNAYSGNIHIFTQEVQKYQFDNIPKLQSLTKQGKKNIIQFIILSGIPQAIALLDFLEYPQHLKKTYSLTKEQIYRHIATALHASPRVIKGNLLGLNPNSNEDTYKYPAIDHKENVKNLYLSLLT